MFQRAVWILDPLAYKANIKRTTLELRTQHPCETLPTGSLGIRTSAFRKRLGLKIPTVSKAMMARFYRLQCQGRQSEADAPNEAREAVLVFFWSFFHLQ